LERKLTVRTTDIAIIGAGPYGLSLAAHLRDSGRSVRIFGSPMRSWSHHMPRGMHLKSEGFASSLYDPQGSFPLKAFCAERGVPYADIGLPVAIETFVNYGMEFQRRFVPDLEETQITSLKKPNGHFEFTTADGEVGHARRVVVAAGIVSFAYVPPVFDAIPREMVSHASQHSDLSGFKGRKIVVIGAGASAIDLAALLMDAGAQVDLVARRQKIAFHERPVEPRSLWQKLRAPRSGLGTGWRSRMCTDIPMVFHALPESLRVKAVASHLGPAPCWFTRDAVARLPMHLGAAITGASSNGNTVVVSFRQGDNAERHIEAEQVIAATGYKASVSSLKFLDVALSSQVRTVDSAPVLNRHFESTIPGLHFIGAAAANSFGPMLRFAFGAGYAARRVAARLRGN
jgi:thioredoxin reductase